MDKEYIHFSIKADWEYIRIFREFINNLLLHRIKNKNWAYDISFIVSELFENSVKYLSKGNILIKIKFINEDKVDIQFKNEITEKNRKKLISEINKLSNNSTEKTLKNKFLSDSFWRNEKGGLGFIMIKDKISGEIKISFKESHVILKCSILLKDRY